MRRSGPRPTTRCLRQAGALAIGVLSAVGVHCSKKGEDVGAAPTASALTASAADPSTASWHYVIDPKSTTHVDMPGLKEHIKAETTAADGSLDIVPSDLARSRGIVRIDLSTLSTHTFGDPDKDATQTKHARTWLEAVVDDKTNEALRWAEFAIRSVEGLSATDVRSVAATRDGADDVRKVTLTVRGDLLVHGHKLAQEDLVDVLFRYPAGAPPSSRPTSVEIDSREPMRVILKDYEVSPRDPAGKLLAWTSNLVSKVADTANVRVDLVAIPPKR